MLFLMYVYQIKLKKLISMHLACLLDRANREVVRHYLVLSRLNHPVWQAQLTLYLITIVPVALIGLFQSDVEQ